MPSTSKYNLQLIYLALFVNNFYNFPLIKSRLNLHGPNLKKKHSTF